MRFGKKPASEEDVQDWIDAADNRRGSLSDDEIIAYLNSKNWYRWWRIGQDYRWVKKQLKKLGVSPERARNLLP